MDETHSIWAICIEHPEHPDKHVVLRYELPVREGFVPELVAVADDLSGARAMLPLGLSKAVRSERERPDIIELWLIDPLPTRH